MKNVKTKETRTDKPSWYKLTESGELALRAQAALDLATGCRLCPRRCGARRDRGEKGACGASAADKAIIARALPHFGEEPPLVGQGGSGTIFFAGCSLRCIFCQNHQISQPSGNHLEIPGIRELDSVSLAGVFLDLQQAGCHNLNLVTATAHLPAVLSALDIAGSRGFNLGIVYNSGGYEIEQTLALLDSVVDIYLPDAKFGEPGSASRLTEGADYVSVNRRAIKEMFRQVGILKLDSQGLAKQGIIVRHLILPGGLAGTEKVLEFLSGEISPEIHISLMAQYYPAHRAGEFHELSRTITESEYRLCLDLVEKYGFVNGWIQALESQSHYRPDFTEANPFNP